MARPVRFHPDFAIDMKAATDYYDGISVALGNRFRQSVRQQMAIAAERPESFAPIHNQIRPALVRYFPYLILYEIHDEFVAILAISHASSDPESWFERRM